MPDVSETLPVPRRSTAELVRFGFLARYSNEQTRVGYAIVIDQWFGWCAEQNIDPLRACRADIEIFARLLEATGRKLSTVANKLNALAGFYKFAVIDEHLTRSPMEHVRRPSIERMSTTNGLDRFELAACLDAGEHLGTRYHALVCLLGLNGMRISGALGIRIREDLGDDRYQPVVTITLKGGGRLTAPLVTRSAFAVRELVGSRADGYLFATSTGRPMVRSYADKMIKRLAQTAGIEKRISCHSFRHAHITAALDNNVDLRDLMNSTGHKDPRTLLYYDRHRQSLARNSTHAVAAWVAGAPSPQRANTVRSPLREVA